MHPITWLLVYFALITAVHAQSEIPLGKFRLLNTDGFIEQGGIRTPLNSDPTTATVELTEGNDDTLNLLINGADLVLFKLPDGLATLTWDAHNSTLLQGIDLQALSNGKPAKDIPAWGANVAWPGLGEVQIVILPLSDNANTGFLVSHPDNRTVVRQMEFRKIFGPKGRPATSSRPAGRQPAIN